MQKILFLLTIMLFCACHTGQEAKTDNMKKEISGTVKDFTGLDGCKYLIVLKNGKKLQPIEVVNNFQWKDGQQIVFSYEEIPDAMTICMAGKVVKVTSIKLVKD